MNGHDIAILGGGASGLSLALALAQSLPDDRSILVVENDSKDCNDRTWCYWTRENSYLDAFCHRTWDSARFISPGVDLNLSLQPYRYQMIRGIDFYAYMVRELRRFPNVQIVNGTVEGWQDGEDTAQIRVDGVDWPVTWVFDSLVSPAKLRLDPRRHHFIKQHFAGWEIETGGPVFDPAVATLFDLRTEQRGGLTFFYLLPFSPTRALVEYTLFSGEQLQPQEYDLALGEYIHDRLPISEYQIVHTESGVIPMTNYPFPRRLGKRVLSIGTLGGRVKPSTGYAFNRIQRDTVSIVQSMVTQGHPFAIPPSPIRYRFYDDLMLDVMAHCNDEVRKIMTAMFTHNPIQRIFSFLDEQAGINDDIGLIASLPPGPFLKALGRYLMNAAKIGK